MNTISPALLKAVFEASWQGALVIAAVLLLRPLLGVRVPARWRHALWLLVLLRLLVPAFLLPPSPASIQNLAVVDHPLEEAGLIVNLASETGQTATSPRSQGPDASSETSTTAPVATSPRQPGWWKVLAPMWAIGFALTAVWILTGMTILGRRLRRDSASIPLEIERIWERCCANVFGLNSRTRRPRLLLTGAVHSPALVGLFRPLLLVPREGGDNLSVDDWEHIFLHELAHYRRRDHWLQTLQLAAACVHWFNPVVWLGFRYSRADRELAADEWALRHLDGNRSTAYGETLLKILSSQTSRTLVPNLVGIMEDRAQMKQRLRHIVAFSPRHIAGSIAGVTVALALAAVVLGRQPDKANLTPYEGLSPAEMLVVAARRGDQPAVTQLLADGVDPNGVVTLRGEPTALTAAVAGHQLETIQLLISKGAKPDLKPAKSDPPIAIALRQGWDDVVDYLRTQGVSAEPEVLAAASGDAAAVTKYVAENQPDFEKRKLLCEIAAAHGHASLFGSLYDSIRTLRGQRSWTAGGGVLNRAIARGDRAVIEEMIRKDGNLTRGGVNRLGSVASKVPGMREWLQAKGFTVPEYTDNERLIDAAEREDLPEIRRLLDAGAAIEYRGEAGWTPVTKASAWGCPRAVKLLLERGADPNSVKNPGSNFSALCLAKTPEIAQLLLDAGANINARLYGQNVHIVSYAVSFGTRELVRWFFDHGVDPRTAPTEEPTLLFHVGKSPEIAELLIERGVDVNAHDKFGRTALLEQLQSWPDPAPVVAVLLKHGADPNERSESGSTPLMSAPDAASVEVLVAAGADVNARNKLGNDVLACSFNADPDRTAALLRHGARFDRRNGASLLVNAVFKGSLDEVKDLLARGVDPLAGETWRGRPTGSPLSIAVGRGLETIAAALRAAGANDVGVLSEAAAMGHLDRMKELLDAGANVNEQSATNMTPLHYAVLQGQSEASQLLLDRGANPNHFDIHGTTAFAYARLLSAQVERQKYSSIARLAVPDAKSALDAILAAIRAHRPDPNYRNENGETALICGAKSGSFLSMDALKQDGVDVNAQRSDGMTALMLAVAGQEKDAPTTGPGSFSVGNEEDGPVPRYSQHGHFVKMLLDRGVDLDLRNKAGQTALDLARQVGNEEILHLLEEASRHKPSK